MCIGRGCAHKVPKPRATYTTRIYHLPRLEAGSLRSMRGQGLSSEIPVSSPPMCGRRCVYAGACTPAQRCGEVRLQCPAAGGAGDSHWRSCSTLSPPLLSGLMTKSGFYVRNSSPGWGCHGGRGPACSWLPGGRRAPPRAAADASVCASTLLAPSGSAF